MFLWYLGELVFKVTYYNIHKCALKSRILIVQHRPPQQRCFTGVLVSDRSGSGWVTQRRCSFQLHHQEAVLVRLYHTVRSTPGLSRVNLSLSLRLIHHHILFFSLTALCHCLPLCLLCTSPLSSV